MPKTKAKTKKLRPMLLRISEECVRELAKQGSARKVGKGPVKRRATAYREAADLLEAWARMSREARASLMKAAAPRAAFTLGFDVLESWATDPDAVAAYLEQPAQTAA